MSHRPCVYMCSALLPLPGVKRSQKCGLVAAVVTRGTPQFLLAWSRASAATSRFANTQDLVRYFLRTRCSIFWPNKEWLTGHFVLNLTTASEYFPPSRSGECVQVDHVFLTRQGVGHSVAGCGAVWRGSWGRVPGVRVALVRWPLALPQTVKCPPGVTHGACRDTCQVLKVELFSPTPSNTLQQKIEYKEQASPGNLCET